MKRNINNMALITELAKLGLFLLIGLWSGNIFERPDYVEKYQQYVAKYFLQCNLFSDGERRAFNNTLVFNL